MEKPMLKVTAILRTKSPLHIASPGEARIDTKTGHIYRDSSQSPSTAACTATQTQSILLTDAQAEERKRVSDDVPVIPANSIRGRIRRTGAKVIKDHLLKRNEKLTLEAYHTLMAGSPNGYPDSVLPSVGEYLKAATHPFFGVFGGGPRLLPSRLKTDTAYPINKTTLECGIVPSAMEEYSTHTWNTQAVMFRRVDDALTMTDPQLLEVVDDVVKNVEDWRELTSSISQEAEGQEAEENNSSFRGVRSWTGHEIVRVGTCFYFQASLDSYNEALRGLFLKAIEGFFNLQNLGGWSRNGYGQYNVIDPQISFSLMNEENQYHSTPFIKINADGQYQLDEDIDEVESYLLALEESLETVTAADIEKYCVFLKNKKPAALKEKIMNAGKKENKK
jgi:CRISPR type IV-associated protein Csf2